MQSTHKIAGADAEGFADYLTADAGRGDYYVPDEDDPGAEDRAAGVWHGSPRALASLGLSAARPVQRDELLALMNGKAPNDGRKIRPVGGNGTRVAGIDMTFSAPKSVSALWAASSGEHREQIERAHREAVESAIKHVERSVELVRTREAGELKWQTANSLVAAQFMHTSSRLTRDQERGGVPDPQLHTHVVVLAAERADVSFAAVDSREVFRSARMNGAWYRSQLAHNLKQQGLQVERNTGRDGRYFEVKGVPKELSERWSTRTAQIEQAAREFRDRYGRDPKGAELGSLTTGTRGTKTLMAQVNVDQAWKAVAGEYGLTREQAHSLFTAREQTAERAQQTDPSRDLGRELVARVTANSSTVSERDLYAIAYERSAGACPPEQARALVKDLARSGELIELRGGVWTTRELREREQQTIATVEERAAERAAPVSEQTVEQAQRDAQREIGAPLSREQREALQTITGQGGVSVLVGQAGVGKGVVLGAASNAWQREGYTVIGTAVAGATAERLGADAKTDRSMTTDALLMRAEKGTLTLGKDTVVMMDEAAMADTNRLAKLVQLTNEKESKLVLAGDGAQLSPIGAGGLFNEIKDRVPSAELKEVHRAQNQWEREAWAQVRDGQAARALAAYQAHDRLHIAETREQAAEKMLADWNKQRMETPEGRTVMLTDASNKELDRINAKAQALREQEGELGAARANLPDRPYSLAAGDQVIFTKPMWVPGQDRVENGTLGTVRDVHDKETLTIGTRGANERDVKVNTSEFQDIKLAYAQHVYKAQGLTTERALTMVGGWQSDRERAYVAVTRAREQTNIYAAREDLGEQGMEAEAIERLAERIAESHAQQASITTPAAGRAIDQPLDPTTDRTITQTPDVQPENGLHPVPERSAEHDGVGATPQGPDPSPSPNERETIEITHEQHPDDREPDHDRGFDLGIE